MTSVLRLAFVLPALLLAAPATAQPSAKRRAAPSIHYVMLDKMIRDFAEQARAEQSRVEPSPSAQDAVLAQR